TRLGRLMSWFVFAAWGCSGGASGGPPDAAPQSEGAPIAQGAPLLPAPAPAEGVQLDLPQVTVPAGQEVQVCRFLKLPSDSDFFFDHVQMETTDGGRHLYVMKSEYFDFPDDFHPDCFAPVDTNTWAVVVNSQTRHVDWT